MPTESTSMNKVNVRSQKNIIAFSVLMMMLVIHNAASAQQKEMLVRVSEIKIDANHLEQYKAMFLEGAIQQVLAAEARCYVVMRRSSFTVSRFARPAKSGVRLLTSLDERRRS